MQDKNRKRKKKKKRKNRTVIWVNLLTIQVEQRPTKIALGLHLR